MVTARGNFADIRTQAMTARSAAQTASPPKTIRAIVVFRGLPYKLHRTTIVKIQNKYNLYVLSRNFDRANPFAPSYRTLPLPALYQRHERAKRARYEERVLEVERAAFTPLVFSASGGASKLATMFLKRLASVLAEKRKEPYSVTMAWLRTRLSFSLLRSAIACLRSSRRKFWGDDLEIHPVLAAGQAWL